jgi:fructose-1,6-bisphosphatase/inositol monophosphatase family enzyme
VPEDCLVLDPIDGTLSLIAGSPAFGIAVCLVRAGHPVQAVVDLPDYRVRLVATAGGEVSIVGDTDRLPRFDSRTVLTSPRQPTRVARLLAGHGPAGLIVTAMPTTTVRMTLVALGHAPAAVYLTAGSAGVSPWDYAAPALALAASGGAVREGTGRDLARTLPAPITGWCATAAGAHLPDLTRLTRAET